VSAKKSARATAAATTRRESRNSKRAPAAPLAAAPEPAAARAALALAIGLAVLALLRAAATVTTGMAPWGLDLARFLGPLFGWPLWAITALALLPWLARPLAPAVTRLGDAMVDSPRAAAVIAAVAGAAIVLAFPDRVRFVGDFLLRQGTVEESGRPGLLFPQALPLDVWLHVTLPTWFMNQGILDANGASRALGACEAGLLAAFAIALVRVLALRGGAAVAVAAVTWWSGGLTMYTGYSKAFGELVLLAVAAVVFALRSLRHGTPPLGLGVVLAIGLTLHRSAVGFLPLLVVTWALWLRTPEARAASRPAVWLALAIPLGAMVWMLPKIVATFLRWDRVHLAPAEVQQAGGPLRAAFAGHRALDMANLLLVLVPAGPALLAALLAFGRDLPRRREALLLLALVLPLAGVIPFIHPAQGIFRDWDDFVSAGAALAVAGAWIAGEVLRGAPRFAWLAPAIVLGSLVPSLQWLGVQSDLGRGLARIQALVEGPPRRTGAEWGSTWDYLGIRNYRLQRWTEASAAFAHAVETSPSRRILREWAYAESFGGDHEKAQEIFRDMTRRTPDDYEAWRGLASESAMRMDEAGAREGANGMLRLHPNDRDALGLLESIGEWEKKQAPETPPRP